MVLKMSHVEQIKLNLSSFPIGNLQILLYYPTQFLNNR